MRAALLLAALALLAPLAEGARIGGTASGVALRDKAVGTAEGYDILLPAAGCVNVTLSWPALVGREDLDFTVFAPGSVSGGVVVNPVVVAEGATASPLVNPERAMFCGKAARYPVVVSARLALETPFLLETDRGGIEYTGSGLSVNLGTLP